MLHGFPSLQALPGAIPAGTPPNVRELLHRTLKKNARDRLHDIADARIELEASAKSEIEETVVAGQSKAHRWIVLVGALGLVGGLILSWLTWGGTATSSVEPSHLSIELLPADVLGVTTTDWIDAPMAPLSRTAFALSPNGRHLVFAGRQGDQQQLFHRPLGEDEARPIPGTENAVNPFFSPHGEWLGFWSDGELKKVELSGGPPVSLCVAQHPVFGASWTTDERITFGQRNALWVVSARGGEPVLMTGQDIRSWDAVGHRLPWVLPGNVAVLFTWRRTRNDTDVVAQSLVTGEQKVLVEGAAHPIYTPTGHLLYVKLGVVWAVPFDPRALELVGTPKPVIDSIVQSTSGSNTENSGAAQISVSASGTLAYVPGGVLHPPGRRLLWADRNGNTERISVEEGNFWFPRISPDGSRVVVSESGQVLVLDLRREITQRLPGSGINASAWSPDGGHVVFQGEQNGIRNLFWQPADGSGPPEPLAVSENTQWPGPWLPDGSAFLFVETRPATSNDILRLDIGQSEAEPTVLLGDPFDERHPAISPDGRWLAYASDESGRNEVYVRAYPDLDGKQQVSSGGGSMPAWSARGEELFYMKQNIVERQVAIMAVDIAAASTFQPGTPRELFSGEFQYGAMRSYDVARDGRFLMIDRGTPRPTHTSIRIVLNWFDELERLVPTE